MTKVDLITGFLGVGKTTFIRYYLRYLRSKGIRVRVIENEFGPLAADSRMLANEAGENCEIEDLTGMCMCCTGMSRFVELLVNAADEGFDRIIVEPSGIYDVDEFFTVMNKPEVSKRCEIGSIIVIADASAPARSTREADYLTFCQLASSGAVLISKIRSENSRSAETVRSDLDSLLSSFGCGPYTMPVIETPWDELTEKDMDRLMNVGWNEMPHGRESFSHADTFRAVLTGVEFDTSDQLRSKISQLFASDAWGKVLRVKGFAKSSAKECFEVNCTSGIFSLAPSIEKRGVLVVIGQELDEVAIGNFMRSKTEI